MTGLVQDINGDKRTEKQIGCMSGLLQQILAGKRIHSSKRLAPSTGVGESPEPVKPDNFQPFHAEDLNGRSKATSPQSPIPEKSPAKLCKEMSRFSLDSKATVDSKGTLRPRELCTDNSVLSVAGGDDNRLRSGSVIARLMGLEPLSSSDHDSSETVAKPELQRSVSESRVSRDLFHSKYIDGNNFQVKEPNQSHNQTRSVEKKVSSKNGVRDKVSNVRNRNSFNGRGMKSMEYASKNLKSESPRTSPWKSPQTTVEQYGDFEKKLKMRGMDEHSSDLDTLKQILDVLQLKGLLHSPKASNRRNHRNFVIDRSFPYDESNIVVMKPCRLLASDAEHHRSGNESQGVRRFAGENSPAISPRRSPVRVRNSSSPNRIESNLKNCNSIVKTKPLSIEIKRRANESSDSLRISPVNSPKLTPKRNGSGHHSMNNRSPRIQKRSDSSNGKIFKKVVTDNESSSSTSSPTNTERSKMEEYREGRNLLQRCDKLLHSIVEMNSSSNTESPPISCSVLPSPVSVLDSGFDKDESSSPSPILKRSIEFKETQTVDFDEENGSSTISSISSKHEEFTSNDSDFVYVSKIVQASQFTHEDCSNVFLTLEKQRSLNSKDDSNVSKLQRKLIFDITIEILNRNRQLPPWNINFDTSLKQIWSEFQKIREVNMVDNLLESICGVLKRDLGEINGWDDHPMETSEAVLDIERMIFKDLVSEAIRDLVELSGKYMFLTTQRKLVF